MQRRTAIWITGFYALLSGGLVHALSLGDIEIYSALNQPLEAEIALTSMRPGEADNMLIKLASEEAFAQAGLDRPFYLTKLNFQLSTRPDGKNFILVTTDNPVREPFLSFLIDIDWPRGHLVREYTVLLDPPVFNTGQVASQSEPAESGPFEIEDIEEELPGIEMESTAGEPARIERAATAEDLTSDLPDIELEEEPIIEETTAADEPVFWDSPVPEETGLELEDAAAPAVTSLAEPVKQRLEQQPLPDIDIEFDASLSYDEARTNALLAEFSSVDSGAPVAPVEQEPASRTAQEKTHEVQAGDTLWEIGGQHKDADVSVQQAMLAILRYNPDAFIRGNINDVKRGFVLRVPEREAMLEISREEAIAEAQRQYALWREYRGQFAGAASAPQDAVAADRIGETETAGYRDTASSGGQLSIVAPGRDAESSSRASGTQEGEKTGSAAQVDLQLAREQLEAERLEKKELQSRLTDLTGQIEKMERLLILKDDQLTQLQNRLRELEAASQVTPAATVPAESTGAPAEEVPIEQEDTEVQTSAATDATEQEESVADSSGEETTGVVGDTAESASQADTASPLPKSDIRSLDESFAISLQEAAENKQPSNLTSPDLTDVNTVADDAVPDTENNTGTTAAEPATDGADIVDTTETIAEPITSETEKPAISPKSQPQKPGFLQPVYDVFYSLLNTYLPAPYNRMATELLESPAGLAIIVAPFLLVLVLLFILIRSSGKKAVKTKPAKKAKATKHIIGAFDHPADSAEESTTTKVDIKKKAALSERLKNAFAPFAALFAKKPKQRLDAAADDEGMDDDMGVKDEDLTAALAEEAAVEAKVKAKTKAQVAPQHKDTMKLQAAAPVAVPEPEPETEQEISDDTTAEADVYLAYGLFDQAEELLKQGITANPGALHYKGKLLETYFAAGKKSEFEKLAEDVHKSVQGKSSRIWDKAVAMGKELAPANPLFSGATSTHLKASDFAPAKPETADLDLGEAGGSMIPDIEFGDDEAAGSVLDLDVSGSFDKTFLQDANADETMIIDDSTVIADDLAFDLPKSNDPTDSELNIDFNADELGLGTDLDFGDDAAAPPASPPREPEATVALDIGMDIDDIDMEGITDVDGSSGFDLELSAGEDLIAELDGDSSGVEIEEGSLDTEFDLSDDDDTIIDSDETFSGDSDGDEVSTKLDLAKAYMDMGDYDGASSTLEEVLAEGSDVQKREAEELLDQIN